MKRKYIRVSSIESEHFCQTSDSVTDLSPAPLALRAPHCLPGVPWVQPVRPEGGKLHPKGRL